VGRQTNTDERRLEIVTGLMRVIARHGYAGASIQEIAKEARLTAGLIHYHFKSKQEILLTLFGHLEALVEARMSARLATLGDKVGPSAELDAMIDAFLALDTKSDERAVMCWTMLSAEAIHNAELGRLFGEAIARHRQRIEEIVARAGTKSRPRPAAVREAASAILAAIHGSFLLGCAAPGVIPRGSAADSVKRIAKGILASG
jgi:TetR/AcrR family transcriptional repressor of bet genes